ncbi:MAG: phage major capsid protein [Kiritimatiellia bacterium]
MKTLAPRTALAAEDRISRPSGRLRPSDHFYRAATASALAKLTRSGGDSEDWAWRLWNGDDATICVLRSAAAPGSTATSGWAAEIAGSAVSDLVASLAPVSAGAALLTRATRVSFSGITSVSLPGITGGATASWVSENNPIPVTAPILDAASIAPRKLGALAVMSEEMLRVTFAEASVRLSLGEAFARAIDLALFSDFAGDASQPPGLLAGINPLDAFPGGDDTAMKTDIGALVSGVSGAGGQVVLVAAVPQAITIQMALPGLTVPIYPSAHLAAGTVIAIAIQALVAGTGPVADFDTTKEATVVMRTDPASMVAGGSTAHPQRSLYQTGTIGLRALVDVAWSLRPSASPAVAWLSASW